jgi:1,4-alpha-glucan branching enzyme
MAKPTSTKRKVTFSFDAPEAQTVLLAGDFTDWEKGAVSLKKDKTGAWKKIVSLAPGKYAYRLLVDGQWRDDPQCPNREPNQFGSSNCICIVDGL